MRTPAKASSWGRGSCHSGKTTSNRDTTIITEGNKRRTYILKKTGCKKNPNFNMIIIKGLPIEAVSTLKGLCLSGSVSRIMISPNTVTPFLDQTTALNAFTSPSTFPIRMATPVITFCQGDIFIYRQNSSFIRTSNNSAKIGVLYVTWTPLRN